MASAWGKPCLPDDHRNDFLVLQKSNTIFAASEIKIINNTKAALPE